MNTDEIGSAEMPSSASAFIGVHRRLQILRLRGAGSVFIGVHLWFQAPERSPLIVHEPRERR
jgi:hypothetical protein